MQTLQIQQSEEIDSFELAIQSRRAADSGADCQICAQQLRHSGVRMFAAIARHHELHLRLRAKSRLNQAVGKFAEDRISMRRILRG